MVKNVPYDPVNDFSRRLAFSPTNRPAWVAGGRKKLSGKTRQSKVPGGVHQQASPAKLKLFHGSVWGPHSISLPRICGSGLSINAQQISYKTTGDCGECFAGGAMPPSRSNSIMLISRSGGGPAICGLIAGSNTKAVGPGDPRNCADGSRSRAFRATAYPRLVCDGAFFRPARRQPIVDKDAQDA